MAEQLKAKKIKKVIDTTKAVTAIGRRKRAIARVKLILNGKGEVIINNRHFLEYFKIEQNRENALAPLVKIGRVKEFDIHVKISGGGIQGQSDAMKLGISRALVELNPDYKSQLRAAGYLTRDSREKERKKFGLRGARKRPQWAKR